MKPTKQQHKIINAIVNGKQNIDLISAGAGTGKTALLKFLIKRILSLYPKIKILYVSFANATINEGETRINEVSSVKFTTSHSLGLQMLINAVNYFGAIHLPSEDVKCLWYRKGVLLKKNFTILDEYSTNNLLKKIVEENGFEASLVKKTTDFLTKCYAHQRRLKPPQYLVGKIDLILKNYAAEKRKMNCIDFNDMIVFSSSLIKRYPQDIRKFIEKYDYIYVDESQDINNYQLDLLCAIRPPTGKLIVAGDPCQMAYSFLGSRVDIFDRLLSIYKNQATLHKLTTSHRCPDAICRLSNAITAQINIENATIINPLENNIGALPEIIKYDNFNVGVDFIVKTISDLILSPSMKYNPEDFVILMRVINGEESIKKLKKLKDSFEAAKIPIKYRDQYEAEAWRYDLMVSAIRVTLKEYCENDLLSTITIINSKARSKKAIESLVEVLQSTKETDIKAIIKHTITICRSYNAIIGKNVENFFLQFNDPSEFYENWNQRLRDYFINKTGVTISTIHSFKGHEVKVVFLFGAEDKEIPYQRKDGGNTEGHLDEERCLLNIAVTRSSEKLFILHERSIFRDGNNISRFLKPLIESNQHFSVRSTILQHYPKRIDKS